VAPISLDLWVLEWVTVALAGGGKEKAGAVGTGGFEQIPCPFRANAERLNRVVEIVLGAGGRGEVHDNVYGAGDVEGLDYVVADKDEAWMAAEMGKVVGAPGEEVVYRKYVVAGVEQAVAEM
jgi:hypothetical protein